MLIGLHVLVLLTGLVVYALSNNGKVMELGRIMFAFGLLALLLQGDRVVSPLLK